MLTLSHSIALRALCMLSLLYAYLTMLIIQEYAFL